MLNMLLEATTCELAPIPLLFTCVLERALIYLFSARLFRYVSLIRVGSLEYTIPRAVGDVKNLRVNLVRLVCVDSFLPCEA